MVLEDSVRAFWNWFVDHADLISSSSENQELIGELDTRVREIHPNLSWEIGPGNPDGFQFVVSSNRNHELRPMARRFVAMAPRLAGWQFAFTRPPKKWDYKVHLRLASGSTLRIDASSWSYVLLKYPDGAYEVLLDRGESEPQLSDEERRQLVEIVLESILGEGIITGFIGEFELLDQLEPRFAAQARPIQELWAAFINAKGRS